jgi:hypothetical protein
MEGKSMPGFQSWFEINKGPIGPPIAHAAAIIGALSTMALTHVLEPMDKTWSVVLILAGYAIPFAIARELGTRKPKVSDEES